MRSSGPPFAGTVVPLSSNPIVPDVIPNSTDRATFQVRIWDNRGGTLNSWEEALIAPGFTTFGYSDLFTVPYALAGAADTPPNLEGLLSFNLIQIFNPVPEPGVNITIVVGFLFFVLHRRSLPRSRV
jgi:hypothetical protein